MKAVIYARYSSDSQREESIEGQLRECKEYAERNGITVLSTYIDRALSAKTDTRPDFPRMIKDSAKGLFDIVLVWKLDRFARNRYDSAHYKAILKKNGVKVVSAKEAIAEGKDPESIVILWNQDKTEIVGYCMLSVDDKGYGGLGPIGIAKKIRGKHVGDYILNQSLQQLRKIGAVRVNIDWTILKDFYGQFGFKAERLYLAAYKEFDK